MSNRPKPSRRHVSPLLSKWGGQSLHLPAVRWPSGCNTSQSEADKHVSTLDMRFYVNTAKETPIPPQYMPERAEWAVAGPLRTETKGNDARSTRSPKLHKLAKGSRQEWCVVFESLPNPVGQTVR